MQYVEYIWYNVGAKEGTFDDREATEKYNEETDGWRDAPCRRIVSRCLYLLWKGGGVSSELSNVTTVVYKGYDDSRLEVKTDGETVWLSQNQMCQLLGRDQSVIARHIGNVFKEGELDRDSVYAKFAYTAADGKTYGKGAA